MEMTKTQQARVANLYLAAAAGVKVAQAAADAANTMHAAYETELKRIIEDAGLDAGAKYAVDLGAGTITPQEEPA